MIDKEFEERLMLFKSNPHHRNFTISIDKAKKYYEQIK